MFTECMQLLIWNIHISLRIADGDVNETDWEKETNQKIVKEKESYLLSLKETHEATGSIGRRLINVRRTQVVFVGICCLSMCP